ncbi:non-hydrolyzing UDP-N-acetylglucosamine 2-epimerase [Desulfosediminicola ganghwensis]|uniref:non-hydrolyzing UDP-N-acetylglucosamine 2-epimerase n=1 Tax=Desulfosediminicola ganghwensis TaxID=2569540 RepID=UPI0010AD43F2|nr:UDP-N-acetylglucosamine 2-epimerase (non-hydrolyzing) [Desulfosediminicola ganghwensis]
MKKILIVFGTRPEAIKMAPLVNEFKKHPDQFDTKLCVTAQHREMLDQVLEFFELIPDFDLNLMKPNQNLFTLTADIINGMKPVLDEVKPDYVFVHGDTTTSTAVALAGFYHGAKVCHVEAGLRTYDKHAPWPEELNRQLTGRIADFHFSPTDRSKQNLLNELTPEKNIIVTGNTVIDALMFAVEKVNHLENDPEIDGLKKLIGWETNTGKVSHESEFPKSIIPDIVLITGHRRENHGKGFENICKAITELAERFPEVQFIYPVHLNPNVREPVNRILKGRATPTNNIHLVDPLDYKAFVWLMDKVKLIITDSGGVQEEAPSLGKPVLVMRDTTERPEAVDAGTVVLVGTDAVKIVNEAESLLLDDERYRTMSMLHNPYGDGRACVRIAAFVSTLQHLQC